MQYRICTFILLICCAVLCASCNGPSKEEHTEVELIPDSTFQLDVINRLDTLETTLSELTTQQDSQAFEADAIAQKKAFQQEVINKLDSVEQQINRLSTATDTSKVKPGFFEGLTAWLRAPFRKEDEQNAVSPLDSLDIVRVDSLDIVRVDSQAVSSIDSLDVTQANVESGTSQREILQRLDSLQAIVNAITVPPDGSSALAIDTTTALAISTPADSSAAQNAIPPTEEARSREDLLNPDVLRKYWGRIFLAILVFLVFMYTIRWITWTLDKLAERSAARRLLFKRIAPVAKILLWIFAVYVIIIYIFEVTGAALISAGAAAGVALAFAGQDVLKNIFGGLIIIADQPFQVGDKITIGGTYGEVVSIGLRSTRIVTSDDNLVSVPNSQVVESQVSNANAGELHCQVVVDLYLPGWTDATKAKSIAYSAAATSKYVFLDKPIVVIVQDDFKEMSLIRLSVKAYVFDCLNELAFKSEVTETAKMEFLRHNMLTPFAYNFRPYLRHNNGGPEDEEAIQQ